MKKPVTDLKEMDEAIDETDQFGAGDIVRLAGGKDEHTVIGFNRKTGKVLVRVEGEQILLPVAVTILVKRRMTRGRKYDYAVEVLRKISRSGLTAGIKTVVESATQTLKDLEEEP